MSTSDVNKDISVHTTTVAMVVIVTHTVYSLAMYSHLGYTQLRVPYIHNICTSNTHMPFYQLLYTVDVSSNVARQ